MYPFTNLPSSLGGKLFAALCELLPAPAIDSQHARDARETIAMTQIADLDPMDAVEAALAIHIVATEAHARDCLRLAMATRDDPVIALRCRDKAGTMLWMMERAMRLLDRRQAARRTAAVVGRATQVRPAREPASEVQPAPEARPGPEPAPRSEPSATTGHTAEALAAADAYVTLNPRMAARLRAGLTRPETLAREVGPDEDIPHPAVVRALIHGRTPILLSVDRIVREYGTEQFS